jgi:hypothetical protein
MKTAICLLFLAQLFGFDYKTTATESIVKQGVLTARSFELNHEKFKDKVADRLLTIQESTMNESKKILIEVTYSQHLSMKDSWIQTRTA